MDLNEHENLDETTMTDDMFVYVHIIRMHLPAVCKSLDLNPFWQWIEKCVLLLKSKTLVSGAQASKIMTV